MKRAPTRQRKLRHGMPNSTVFQMKDLQEIASFESCETGLRYSRCTRQGRVEAPTLWMKCILWQVGERVAGLSIGREGYGSSSRAQVSVAGFVTSHRAAHGRDQELEPGANLAEHRGQFLAVPVPQMTEQLGEVPKMVSQNRIQRRTAK